MIVRLITGIAIGAVVGGIMGYYGKCSSGACPLTANPYRGAIYGGVMGALFALSLAGSGKVSKADVGIESKQVPKEQADNRNITVDPSVEASTVEPGDEQKVEKSNGGSSNADL